MMIHWSLSAPVVAKFSVCDENGRPMFLCLIGDEPRGKDFALIAEAANLKWALARMLELNNADEGVRHAHVLKSLAILNRANGTNPEAN